MSLELKEVRKSYRQPGGGELPVLDVPHFKLNAGEQVALVGQSGGGKTTLLNAIAGITSVDSGSVIVDNAERIGIVFQTFHLLPAFTALENVLLGMSFSGKSNAKHAKELLDRVGLGDRMHHRPGQMSVGEQQRVSVARALANQPQLMLADEPTASVDLANQDKILKLLRDACSENKISLLLVTHSKDVSDQFERVEQLSQFNKAGAQEVSA
ncbi:UNVERIFIED_CONTAM: hypothetical protein GTU68_062371 [Idotea baltica]|nr:hypothetical protein [Idotea baltica]